MDTKRGQSYHLKRCERNTKKYEYSFQSTALIVLVFVLPYNFITKQQNRKSEKKREIESEKEGERGGGGRGGNKDIH